MYIHTLVYAPKSPGGHQATCKVITDGPLIFTRGLLCGYAAMQHGGVCVCVCGGGGGGGGGGDLASL